MVREVVNFLKFGSCKFRIPQQRVRFVLANVRCAVRICPKAYANAKSRETALQSELSAQTVDELAPALKSCGNNS